MKNCSLSSRAAYTLVEVLSAVTIITVVTSVAVEVLSSAPESTAEQKLQSDVRSLNTAIDIYLTFGGSLEGADTPQDVLRRLQTKADSLSAERTAGITGTLIDPRMRVKLQPESEVSSTKPRVVWDSEKKRFAVAHEGSDGQIGVSAFVVVQPEGDGLDPNGTSLYGRLVFEDGTLTYVAEEEGRNPNLKLSSEGDWIWDYNDTNSGTLAGPTPIGVPGGAGGSPGSGSGSSGGSGSGGSSGGSGSGGAGGPGSSPSAVSLSPPTFSVDSGEYPVTDYDLSLELTNPNPPGVSRILYQIGAGVWNVYAGTPITIPPTTYVTAYCETVHSEWLNSGEDTNTYDASVVKLKKPKVMNNNGHGNNYDGVDVSNPGNAPFEDTSAPDDDERWVEVILETENDPLVEEMEYRINGGAWVKYNGEFYLFAEDYPVGAIVDARAQAIELYYDDSDEEGMRLQWLDPQPFDHPGIALSDSAFDSDPANEIVVTVTSPNDPAVSEVRYRIQGGSWQPYIGPVSLAGVDYDEGVDVSFEAKIVGTVTQVVNGEILSLPDSGIALATIYRP